jgi:hypothetical protein
MRATVSRRGSGLARSPAHDGCWERAGEEQSLPRSADDPSTQRDRYPSFGVSFTAIGATCAPVSSTRSVGDPYFKSTPASTEVHRPATLGRGVEHDRRPPVLAPAGGPARHVPGGPLGDHDVGHPGPLSTHRSGEGLEVEGKRRRRVRVPAMGGSVRTRRPRRRFDRAGRESRRVARRWAGRVARSVGTHDRPGDRTHVAVDRPTPPAGRIVGADRAGCAGRWS